MEKLDYNLTSDEFVTICSNIAKIHGMSHTLYEMSEDKISFEAIMIRGIEGISLLTFDMLQKLGEKKGD